MISKINRATKLANITKNHKKYKPKWSQNGSWILQGFPETTPRTTQKRKDNPKRHQEHAAQGTPRHPQGAPNKPKRPKELKHTTRIPETFNWLASKLAGQLTHQPGQGTVFLIGSLTSVSRGVQAR